MPAEYTFTLPTEAQWEYACRAGTTTRFSFGDAPDCQGLCFPCSDAEDHMLWCGNSHEETELVASRQPNAWGLYDMHGGVWEWCADWWSDALPGGSVIDPTGPSLGEYRVYRGGSWSSFHQSCRSANRNWDLPIYFDNNLGFRVALVRVP